MAESITITAITPGSNTLSVDFTVDSPATYTGWFYTTSDDDYPHKFDGKSPLIVEGLESKTSYTMEVTGRRRMGPNNFVHISSEPVDVTTL